ncbi:hypothetical protein E2G06_06930, partial [Salmonella enterica subsp. enterica]|nr:hypothetical protein [Salmonella enterica subsp. enterica]
SFAFSDWRCRRAKPTIKIPEVLIGEIIRYALRTCLLHQPARMRRFFFEPILLSLLLRNSCNLPQFMF